MFTLSRGQYYLIATIVVAGVESQGAISKMPHGVHALVILLNAAKGHSLGAGDPVMATIVSKCLWFQNILVKINHSQWMALASRMLVVMGNQSVSIFYFQNILVKINDSQRMEFAFRTFWLKSTTVSDCQLPQNSGPNQHTASERLLLPEHFGPNQPQSVTVFHFQKILVRTN